MSNDYYAEKHRCFIELESAIKKAVFEKNKEVKVDALIYEMTKIYKVGEKTMLKRVEQICHYTMGLKFDPVKLTVSKE